MFEYISELFSSLLNMSAFTRETSTVSEKESSENLIKKEEKKETQETFEFIEITDDDAEDMFITKF
jgi:hypothetical protein